MLSIKQFVFCFLLVSGFAYARADAVVVAASADSTVVMSGSDTLLAEAQEHAEPGFSPFRSLREQHGAAIERAEEAVKQQRPRWALLTVFLLFLAVALIRVAFPGDFALIFLAFYQERRIRHIGNADNTLTSWPYVFLFLAASLVFGLFVVLLDAVFLRQEPVTGGRFLQTALVVCVLGILKILTTRLVGIVFGVDTPARRYIAVLYSVYFNGAFFLMPFLLAAVFAPDRYLEPVLVSSGAVAIVLAYRLLKAVLGLFHNPKFSIFYLILYICMLEVTPIIVLIKLLGG